MGSFKNFQSDNKKYTKNRYNVNNPEFNSFYNAEKCQSDKLNKLKANQHKFILWASFFLKYPDYFIDMITPKESHFKLYPYQRIMLRVFFRYQYVFGTFTRGSSKCVSGDTYLFTDNGMLPIGELCNYDKNEKELFKSINIKDGLNNVTNTETLFVNGFKDTIKIKTNEGYKIEGTLNHKIITINQNGTLKFKRLDEINIGDYVAISRKNSLFGNKIDLDCNMDYFFEVNKNSINKINNCLFPNKLDENLAKFIGMLIGNGTLTRDNLIIYTSKDENLVNDFKFVINNYFGLECFQEKNKPINYIVYGKIFREYLRQVGLDICGNYDKEIPKCILQSPKNIVSSFLQGLFDTNGTVAGSEIQFYATSKKLAKQVHILLLNFGIISILRKYYNKKFNTYHYKICIRCKNINLYNESIGFSVSYKNKKLKELCKKNRNLNVDIIPYQHERIKNICLNNKNISRQFEHVRMGKNNLTYEELDTLKYFKPQINEDTNILSDLNHLYYYWAKVTEKEQSKNYVYDLSVPSTHSYIGNGFVNHNSFVEILANFLLDIMRPGLKNSVTAAGSKQQGRDIANEKFNEIKALFPALEKEIMSLSVGKDYLDLKTYNNSELNIVGCHNTSRGGRKHVGTIEEAFDIDVTTMNEVILPMFNVKRRTITGYENPEEFDEQIWYVTTAGFYDTDICRKQIEMLKNMCYSLKYTGNGTYFVFGSSFELPLHHGLLKQSKVDSIKKDPSFSQISFNREYRSIWIKFSDKSFFKLDVINNCRTIKYCELEADFKNHKDDFYILSYDVSRMGGSANDASIATIIRCTPKKDGTFYKNVVAIYAYEDENKNNTSVNSIMHFKNQSIEIKRLADKYQVKAVLLDAGGVGQGLVDFLTDSTEDEEYGKTYKPYCVVSVNGDESKGEKTQGSLPILHLMKVVTSDLYNDIHNTMLGHLQTKNVRLLTNPMEAENNIEIKYGKKLTQDKKADLLVQYHQTDFLIQEMMQLEIEMKGNNVSLKTMTKNQRKDRYTSLSYGVWWVAKYYEVKYKKDNREDFNISTLFQFRKPQIRKR